MVGTRRFLFFALFLLWGTLPANPVLGDGDAADISEPIELLEVIEVTGTTVTKTARTLSFPLPDFGFIWPTKALHQLQLTDLYVMNRTHPSPSRILLDQTGAIRGRFTNVNPLKTERPIYPRMAREQGWQGTVLLRAHITDEGNVQDATIQNSSGFSLLDDSAVQAVRSWTFEPAKNGRFNVASVVDLPIRFDLLQ